MLKSCHLLPFFKQSRHLSQYVHLGFETIMVNLTSGSPSIAPPSSSWATSITGTVGSLKPSDVFLPGSRGDTEVCDRYWKKTPEGTCAGRLNGLGTHVKDSTMTWTPEDWVSLTP